MNQYNPNQNNVYRSMPPRRAGGANSGGVVPGGVNPGGANVGGTTPSQQQFGFSGGNETSATQGGPGAFGEAPKPFEMQQPYQPYQQQPVQPAPQSPQYEAQPYQAGYAPAGGGMAGMPGAMPITVHEQKWADPTYMNATFGQRVGAYFIDALILTAIQFLVMLIFQGIGDAGGTDEAIVGSMIIGLIVMVVIGTSYKMTLEATMGQTLGKKALGLRLITTDGIPMGWGHSFKRNFNILYGLIPFVGGFVSLGSYIGRFFSVMNSPYNQGYHDRWANTRLIKER